MLSVKNNIKCVELYKLSPDHLSFVGVEELG